MGWASGGELMDVIVMSIEKNVLDYKSKVSLYKDIIDAFEMSDWDTQDECMGMSDAFDEAMKRLHPSWF